MHLPLFVAHCFLESRILDIFMIWLPQPFERKGRSPSGWIYTAGFALNKRDAHLPIETGQHRSLALRPTRIVRDSVA
jgi:hypothetical protein